MTPHAVASTPVRVHKPAFWATAAIADAADTTPMESRLSAPMSTVARARAAGCSRLQCAADSLIGFIAPRFVTTAVIVAIVFGIASLIA